MSNKKYFFFFIALLALVVAPYALAQGFVPLAPIPGLTGEGNVSTTAGGLPTFFNNLYKLLIGFAAIAAVIQIIRSGIELALNQGSVSEIISSKGRVMQSIYGLVLVLIPALVFGIINPNILNLSVSLPDITYTERTVVETPPVIRNGCLMKNSGEYIEDAVCPKGKETSYTCANGGVQTLPPLVRRDATEVAVSCRKEAEIIAYDGGIFSSAVSLIFDLSSIVPADKPTYQKFRSECNQAQGKLVTKQHFLQSPLSGNCSIDTGLDSEALGTKRCFGVTLSCAYK